MILRLGCDLQFEIPSPVAMVALLNVHPSRVADLRAPDELCVEPAAQVESYIDGFGNRCTRFVAPGCAIFCFFTAPRTWSTSRTRVQARA